MCACRDFAYEPHKKCSRNSSTEWGRKKKLCKRKHWAKRPTTPSTCTLYRLAAYFARATRLCLGCGGMHHISLQIGKQNDVASTLNTTETASRAQQIECSTYRTTDIVRFATAQQYCQATLLLLAVHSIYHRAQCTLIARRSAAVLKCRKLLNVTPSGVNFASISYAFQLIFRPSSSSSSSSSLFPLDAKQIERVPLFDFEMEIVRHDLLIQTRTIRFNLNGIFSNRHQRETSPMRAMNRPNGIHMTTTMPPSPSWTT